MEEIFGKIRTLAISHNRISPELIKEKNIKLGLRNADGSGVIAGITSKGLVIGYDKIPEGTGYKVVPSQGKLYYCGYDVDTLVRNAEKEKRPGYEEIVYLLMTGELPNKTDLDIFSMALAKRRALNKIERNILMQEAENDNQMFALHAVISHMSMCDPDPSSLHIDNVSDRCIDLIAKFPTVVAYNYNVMRYRKGESLSIIKPDPDLSTAENFLYMLKGQRPSPFEASLFDLDMSLHAEHGGGNNSTFTVRTVSSSGANTYMAICSGIASLSGHLHGGATEAIMNMMRDLKKNVRDWEDRDEIKAYLEKILDRQAFDRQGKIYGMGHAVYTLSDPRAVLLKKKAGELARMKRASHEFRLYENVAETAVDLIHERKGLAISPNVDFYSGFIYRMMGIPKDLYIPIFAMSRVVGWSAHRIEQIIQDKIIRPGYVSSLSEIKEYVPLKNR